MLDKKRWAIFSLLVLCGGTIYKLPSLKDAFYVPMQEYFHLTNGQIGNAMSVNSIVTTIGFFLSIYFSDKLPRRLTISFSLIATGLLGNSSQQGRIFGFFETGRGVVDTVVAFSALAVFAWFGSGYLGFKMGILFYSGVAILVGGIIFLFLKDDKHAVTEPVNESGENKEKKPSVSAVLKDGTACRTGRYLRYSESVLPENGRRPYRRINRG